MFRGEIGPLPKGKTRRRTEKKEEILTNYGFLLSGRKLVICTRSLSLFRFLCEFIQGAVGTERQENFFLSFFKAASWNPPGFSIS